MCRDINTNWQPYACMQTRILQVILLNPCCGRVNTSPLLCLTWMATYWRDEVAVSLSTPGKRNEIKCYAYNAIEVIISAIQYTYMRKYFAVDHSLSCIEVTEVHWEQASMLVKRFCPVCRTTVSYIQLSHDLGSKENYGELDLHYFNCARVYADSYLWSLPFEFSLVLGFCFIFWVKYLRRELLHLQTSWLRLILADTLFSWGVF